jgi:hypothetical protein
MVWGLVCASPIGVELVQPPRAKIRSRRVLRRVRAAVGQMDILRGGIEDASVEPLLEIEAALAARRAA